MVTQLLSIHDHLICHIKPWNQILKMKLKLDCNLPPTREQTPLHGLATNLTTKKKTLNPTLILGLGSLGSGESRVIAKEIFPLLLG